MPDLGMYLRVNKQTKNNKKRDTMNICPIPYIDERKGGDMNASFSSRLSSIESTCSGSMKMKLYK